jgi:hypothetical protein
MATHRALDDGESLSLLAVASRVEYVGGPRDGHSEDLAQLPDVIAGGDGRYRRSVRCAEDGAMRYVWIAPDVVGRT